MEVSIFIDLLTNCLIRQATGEECDTVYRLVSKQITKDDAKTLTKNGWQFDWSLPHENDYEVYELLLADNEEVQGMIALKHINSQLYTHIDIVEAAPHNIGSKGTFKGVGAHLFAIACKLSWDNGNEGYVQFSAKSNLIDHYIQTLNAQLIDAQNMFIDSYGAMKLIHKYFKDGD